MNNYLMNNSLKSDVLNFPKATSTMFYNFFFMCLYLVLHRNLEEKSLFFDALDLTKTQSKEKETKEINGTLKDYSNGAIFQTLREKTNSEDYHEVFFNSKNFESNNKKVQDFLINNTKSCYLFLTIFL